MTSAGKSQPHFVLDDAAGWRKARQDGLAASGPDANLTLNAITGNAALLLKAEEDQEAFRCPSALALGGHNDLLVADAATDLIKRIDLATGSVQTLAGVGGKGDEPRRLNQPRGVAAYASGAIIVSDTANHRVQVFSPYAQTLTKLWGATNALGRPAPGRGLKEFRRPWAVRVDECGNAYIIDRDNRRIQRIAFDGTSLPALGEGYLINPTRLAIGPGGLVAVVDQNPDTVAGQRLDTVLVFSPKRKMPRTIFDVQEPRSVAFDDEGRLYIGDGIGLLHVFVPDPEAALKYRLVGAGDTNVTGEIVDLVWDRAHGLLAIIREQFNGIRQRLWKINPAGAFAQEGTLITRALDSRIEQCRWHRVELDAAIPEGTSIQIDSYTSDSSAAEEIVTSPDFKGWQSGYLAGDDNPDCLVQSGPGQFLWLRLRFRSNGLVAPVVRRIKVYFPRDSYLKYLPSVYQEDEESRLFLDRFLSIFQTEFDNFDRKIDEAWQLFDPDTVADQHLDYLASWVGLSYPPEWIVDDPQQLLKKRELLKRAIQAHRRRGTADGIEQAVTDYGGVHFAKVLEHYRLRRWPALSVAAPLDGSVKLWSRDFYKRLQLTSYSQIGYFRLIGHPEPMMEPFDWGAHQFTVFFPASPYQVSEIEQNVARVVEREKPVHTQATLCPVLPRLRVGVQATVGVDAVVGSVSHMVLNQMSTLNYDTILGCSAQEHQLRDLGTAVRPRTGLTTKLF